MVVEPELHLSGSVNMHLLATVVVALAFSVQLVGCAKENSAEISQVIPHIHADTHFGPLYPSVLASLQAQPPDVASALRDTREWATEHLEGFASGACANVQILDDNEFVKIFGRSTLGVTLPWMQIYIRDGNREEDSFLWHDPSLFVSTVLHEHVHAMQRARQAQSYLGVAPPCEDALNALNQRRLLWTSGFDNLRGSSVLGPAFGAAERTLLYHWISPIERARDEIDAAITTVRWMHDHSDELSELTMGGANNWAYGVQYLGQLKRLAHSDCFSPDRDTFDDETRIYTDEMPRFLAEYTRYESDMRYFLQSHNVSVMKLSLTDLQTLPAPTGRDGPRCNSSHLAEFPVFPALATDTD